MSIWVCSSAHIQSDLVITDGGTCFIVNDHWPLTGHLLCALTELEILKNAPAAPDLGSGMLNCSFQCHWFIGGTVTSQIITDLDVYSVLELNLVYLRYFCIRFSFAAKSSNSIFIKFLVLSQQCQTQVRFNNSVTFMDDLDEWPWPCLFSPFKPYLCNCWAKPCQIFT